MRPYVKPVCAGIADSAVDEFDVLRAFLDFPAFDPRARQAALGAVHGICGRTTLVGDMRCTGSDVARGNTVRIVMELCDGDVAGVAMMSTQPECHTHKRTPDGNVVDLYMPRVLDLDATRGTGHL